MLSNIQRKPHIKKNFGSLSRGQKGQNPPHSLDLEKKSKFSKKNLLFFCELNHSEQENEKKKLRSLLTLNILMILILTIFNFQFTCFCFLPHLCALQLWTQKMLEQKYLIFLFDFNFDDFDFLLLLLKVTKVGDLSCVLVVI